MTDRPLPAIFKSLAYLQAHHPWRLIAVAIISLFPAIWATSGLGFKSSFNEMLPDNKPSVIEARRVSERLAGSGTLTVVAQIDDKSDRERGAALRAFVDRLVPKLEALGKDYVGVVDYGVHASEKFFDENKLLYADLESLKEVRDDVIDRYDWEVSKASDQLLDEEDPPPEISIDSLREKLERKADAEKSKDKKPAAEKTAAAKPKKKKKKHPHGYFQSPEEDFIAVLIRTPVSGKEKTEELKRKVREVVAEVNPTSIHPKMKVGYTGGVITGAEEYNAIIRDLGEVGFVGVSGVLLSVFFFFLRIRSVMTMGATLIIGLLWTFGLTFFTIGHLNSSTGFLVSIIAGNGINYGIMFQARYIEARRDQGLDVPDAILFAHRDTWVPTLASGATAALAYGSLVVTDFRGFKHFGVIGGYGMLLCWLATYLFMPAILAASERVLPAFKKNDDKKPTKVRGYYGVIFSKLAGKFPRALTIAGVALGIASIGLTVKYFAEDPMEYNLKKIRNERKDESVAGNLSHRVDKIVGRLGQDGMAIMTDRLDQVPLLEKELQKVYDAAPEKQKPFENVVTVYSLLPKNQAEKLPVAKELLRTIRRARKRGFIKDKDWKELEPELPKGKLSEIRIENLPELVARSFTERDGTVGRIVFIVPKSGFSVWDAKYLMRWADSYRETTLPNGEKVLGSGSAVIFADMIKTVGEDIPKAISVASLGTILVLLIAFRFGRESLGVFLPWLLGVSMLGAFLYLMEIKLNFLNFVAIPITIGIGAEYAHNLMQRYRVEGDERILHVVRETGGAVILCSLTTTIGYLALMWSINHGIRSFGLAAAMGEVFCIGAAVLVLPAALVWRAKRRAARSETM